MSNFVKAKKHLGQHFLKDKNIADKIASTLVFDDNNTIIEVGPGTGMLSQFLFKRYDKKMVLMEVDQESIQHLHHEFPERKPQVLEQDFLKADLKKYGPKLAITGNFPYNISSQIVFKVLENKNIISEFSGMFQKEVAERLTATHGNKSYGILTVLLQTFFDTKYLFTVNESVFQPPPKVKSGVMYAAKKTVTELGCDEQLLFTVVKTAFNQRRKTLRNSLSSIIQNREYFLSSRFEGLRPEQLSVPEFIELTQLIEKSKH